MLAERIIKAVAALRAAGHQVEAVPGANNGFRVDGGDAVNGPALLAMAIRLGLMDTPWPSG